MSKALSYINEKGFTVFTSYYLQLKGGCCKCSCLHCPYGYTIQKHGLSFEKLTVSSLNNLGSLIGDLLEGVGLHPQRDLIQLIYLKNHLCGFFSIQDSAVDKIILLEEFSEQNINKELISSYFFKSNSSNQTKKHKRSYKN